MVSKHSSSKLIKHLTHIFSQRPLASQIRVPPHHFLLAQQPTMSTAVLQLTLLKLKPDAHLDEVGSPAGDALLDVVSAVKKAGGGGGKNRAFFGHQLENPDIGVLAFGGFFLLYLLLPSYIIRLYGRELIYGISSYPFLQSTRQQKPPRKPPPRLRRPSSRLSVRLPPRERSSSPPRTGWTLPLRPQPRRLLRVTAPRRGLRRI